MIEPQTDEQSGQMTAPTANGRVPVTVIILTFNEQENIGPCIASVDWADDIVVVDSHSTDATVAAARDGRPDVRVFANEFTDFGQQRNWALDETSPRHEWVLFLDADERGNDEFAAAVRRAIASPGEHVGFFLCYRNMFLGRWIRRSTLYPSWQLRLLRVGCVRYVKEGHGQREVSNGALGYVKAPYDHYGFSKGVADWVARHNRYSSDEIELVQRLRDERLRVGDLFRRDAVARRRCMKRIAARIGFRPVFRFLYLYVLRLGVLDGYAGLMFCLLRVAHECHITVKLAETEHQMTCEPATSRRNQAAHDQPHIAAAPHVAGMASRDN